MFKRFLILSFILFCTNVYAEEVMYGSIKYNESTARVEAFRDIERKIDRSLIKDYLKDPNRKENLEAISKNVFEIEFDRYLCPFYLKKNLISYAVTYNNNPQKTYYYNIFGSLIKFEMGEVNDFPRRTFAYSRFGNLLSVNFDIDGTEQFVYKDDGKLIAHWIGDNYVGKHSKILNITRGEKPEEKTK